MKREIKFRAYIPTLDIMLYGITPYADGMIGISADDFEEALEAKNPKWRVCDDGVYLSDDDHFDLIMSVLPGEDWYWIESDKCEQLQFTGLKDKKGKEIYESDVVVWHVNNLNRTGVVEYVENYGGYDLKHTYDEFHVCCDWLRGEYEVIGNIYENPELIKSNNP
jgi:uncharacterized phage protein (TIGR01671 family)